MRTTRYLKELVSKSIYLQHLLAAIVLILFLSIFYRDVIFGGKTFLIETAAPGTMPFPPGGPYNYEGIQPGFVAVDPGAIAWQTEPFNRYISRLIKRGDFPLWNPHSGLAGTPLFADGHTAPLELIQLIFFFLPTRFWALSTDVQLLIRYFIAGFSCYLFARRLKINFWGSVAAGTLFLLSSYFVVFGAHPKMKTNALLPLVILGYEFLSSTKDYKAVGLCALFISWSIIAGMPEGTFFILFLGTLWYFYKVFFRKANNKLYFQNAIDDLSRYLQATVLGFLVSAVFLLPFLEYVTQAKSVHEPNISGVFFLYPLWALPILIFQVQNSYFLQLGFFTVFSLVITLFNTRSLSEHRGTVWFFGIYAIVTQLISFDFLPTNWIRSLPVFNQINIADYSVPTIVFSLSIVVGILVDKFSIYFSSYKQILLSILFVVLVFIIFPALSNPYNSLFPYFEDEKIKYMSIGIIVLISVTLCLLAFFSKHIRGNYIQIGLLFLILVEPFFWSARFRRPNRVDPFQTPPFVDFLRNDKQLYRIFGMNHILYPNIATAYQISDIRWLNALVPYRMYEFSTRFIAEEAEIMRMDGSEFPISDAMFNILNVKYVITRDHSVRTDNLCHDLKSYTTLPYFGSHTLNKKIIEENSNNKNLNEELVTINGKTAIALFAHPPQEFELELLIPETYASLDFLIGLDPRVFDSDKGDGVTFQIVASDTTGKTLVFSKYINPKHNPCDRTWFEESLKLDEWAGKNVRFTFITESGPAEDASWDWAYWGEIQLNTTFDQNDISERNLIIPKYRLVYQKNGVQIYQNDNVFPRAFVVYNIINVSDFETAMEQLEGMYLDLRQTAVVENLPAELESRIHQGDQQLQPAIVDAKLIGSGELNIQVNTMLPGLLVVTDQYYPGWKAYVNGKLTPIYAVNGIFRGVYLDKGEHLVKFKYRPLSFITGSLLSILSLISVLFLLTKKRA